MARRRRLSARDLSAKVLLLASLLTVIYDLGIV